MLSALVFTALHLAAPAAAQEPVETIAQNMGDVVSMGGTAGTNLPDYYTVQTGDTLWEISSAFLGNAFYWPRLWSINDYVTNPHWIYPGNKIRFRMGTLLEPPSVDLDTGGPSRNGYGVQAMNYGTVDADCGPDMRFTRVKPARTYIAPTFLREPDEVEVYGTVPKAKPQGTILAERDLLYLKLDDPDAYDCGDVVSIFRLVTKKVKGSDREKYGSLYKVVAEAKIVHRYGDYVTAVVRQSWEEIERGDLVGPAHNVAVDIEVVAPTGDIAGNIIARSYPEHRLLSIDEPIFINRGRGDGVRVGASFYIIESRDEALDRGEEDLELPPAVIGRAVIVAVNDDSSTAIITEADRNIQVGYRVVQKMPTEP